jgi:hypothetical protein
MSLKVLELEQIELTYPIDGLKLSIISQVEVRLPSGKLASLDQEGLIKVLRSGNVWVSRGRACRLDMQLSFNGKLLNKSNRMQILEVLGYCLSDAYVSESLLL